MAEAVTGVFIVVALGLVVALVTVVVDVRRRLAHANQEARWLRALLGKTPAAWLLLDADGQPVMCSKAAEALLADGAGRGVRSGTTEWRLPASEQAALREQCLWRQADRGLLRQQLTLPSETGRPRVLQLVAAPFDGPPGPGWVGVLTDVTEDSERAEEARRLGELLAATPDLVAMVSTDGSFQYVNPAAARVLGVSREGDLRGLQTYTAESRQVMRREAVPAALRDGVWQGEVMMRQADGRSLPVSQVLIAHRAANGSLSAFSSVSRDLSQLQALEARLSHSVLHDALTGLPNRTLLVDRLGQALVRSQRLGTRVAVLLLDLDRFTLVNDTYGHDLADSLLVRVAERIIATVRAGDTACRLSGDEFAVLCEDLTDETAAVEIADKVSAALAAPYDLDVDDADRQVYLTSSVGVTLSAGDGQGPEALLRDADTAMTRAKSTGRARTVVFAERLRTASVTRLRTANDLHRALQAGEFRLEYQPEACLPNGRLVAVEALLRWDHPRRGPVSPDEFIPLAEELGIIEALGAWVLDEACRQAAVWRRRRYDGSALPVWVNVSARQLDSGDLVAQVESALARHDVRPASLGLEVTESALLADADTGICVLNGLHALGVRLAVDDFGTGYSSLAYLKRLPVDAVKIDRSFVAGLGESSDDTAIVRAVTGLAAALRITCVAEGVENAEQLAALRELGCQVAQGYLLARPQDPAAIDRLLETDRRSESWWGDHVGHQPHPLAAQPAPRACGDVTPC